MFSENSFCTRRLEILRLIGRISIIELEQAIKNRQKKAQRHKRAIREKFKLDRSI